VPLFDKALRDYMGPASFGESDFHWLNRSARAEVNRIRDLVDSWFEDYFPSARADLRSRFRSTDNRQHLGAFFELYCYALGRYQGYRVDIAEPVDLSRSTRPDFLFRRNDKPACYLENTLAAGSDTLHAAEARSNQIIDGINRLKSPDFILEFQVERASSSQPSASRIRSFLERRLRELDYDAIVAGGPDLAPRWVWRERGWQVTFIPLPKKQEARNRPGRPIGIIHQQAREVDSKTPLLNALQSKAGRYGQFEYPYIIAVNAMDPYLLRDEFVETLFGGAPSDLRHMASNPNVDGLWIGPEGPRNRRVSAVLITFRLTPWNIATETPVMWHNPWATNKFDDEHWVGPHVSLNLQTLTLEGRHGKNGCEFFRLNPKWPRKQ
jgi:hypothetical protein